LATTERSCRREKPSKPAELLSVRRGRRPQPAWRHRWTCPRRTITLDLAALTFHGLRHTVGTLLIEAGADIDTVRRWLGQKTLAMAIHYSETADASAKMQGIMRALDPLGTKRRTKVSNSAEKVSNSDSDF
jgi:integrase